MLEAINNQRSGNLKTSKSKGRRKINCLLFEDWLSAINFLLGIFMRCALWIEPLYARNLHADEIRARWRKDKKQRWRENWQREIKVTCNCSFLSSRQYEMSFLHFVVLFAVDLDTVILWLALFNYAGWIWSKSPFSDTIWNLSTP